MFCKDILTFRPLAIALTCALAACNQEPDDTTLEKLSADPKASSQWFYSTLPDEMRNIDVHAARIQAEGDLKGQPLLVINETKGKYSIAIRPSYDGGALMETPSCFLGRTNYINIKVDDGPIIKTICEMGMDTMIDAAIVPKIKSGKKLLIEMDNNGSPKQYTFKIAGLKI